MIRQLTGILLALLIANPFCCCFGALAGNEDDVHLDSPSPERACCAKTSRPSTSPSPGGGENETPCDCDRSGHSPALLSESGAILKAPALIPVPSPDGSISFSAADFDHFREISIRFTGRSTLLPTYQGGPSPGRVHAIVHGVFLI